MTLSRFRFLFQIFFIWFAHTGVLNGGECGLFQFNIVDLKNGITDCQDCLKCPPGYEALPPCDSLATKSSPVNQSCYKCQNGFFNSLFTELQCSKCAVCVKDKPYIRKCTAYLNAKCSKKCIVGKYEGRDNKCYPCCRCFSGENRFELQCATVPGKVSEETLFQ